MVELVHGTVDTMGNDLLCGIQRTGRGFPYFLVFRIAQFADDPIHNVIIRMGRSAHTDFDPRIILCAQLLRDAFDAIVSAVRTAAFDAEFSRRKGNIIMDHDHMFRRDPVKSGGGLNSLAAEIHVCLRTEEED